MENLNADNFRSWAYQDLLNNTTRGHVAEYLVSQALNITAPRVEWAPWDLTTAAGMKIEVKSSAYIQTWHQEKASKISFDIGKTKAWDPATNVTEQTPARHADIYIFCVLHGDRPEVVGTWDFYILDTYTLNKLGNQKTITLGSLKKQKPVLCDWKRINKFITPN